MSFILWLKKDSEKAAQCPPGMILLRPDDLSRGRNMIKSSWPHDHKHFQLLEPAAIGQAMQDC